VRHLRAELNTSKKGTSIYADAFTGLLNRRYSGEALAREVARAQNADPPLALVVVDLDHLSQINDRFAPA
jgi:diguanylate cyclase (GGDEF)-like protein